MDYLWIICKTLHYPDDIIIGIEIHEQKVIRNKNEINNELEITNLN